MMNATTVLKCLSGVYTPDLSTDDIIEKRCYNGVQFPPWRFKYGRSGHILHGVFINYLIRYIMCTLQGVEFRDVRADYVCETLIPPDEYSSDEELDDLYPDYRRHQIIRDAYRSIDDNIRDNIKRVFYTSFCQQICFGETDYKQVMDDLKDSEIIDDDLLDKLIAYCKLKIEQHDTILCNPTIGDGKYIKADCNLIIGDTIIDIKTSTKKAVGNDIKDYYQLLIYAALCRKRDIDIKRITIFNPLFGYERSIDISDWNSQDLYDTMVQKVVLARH